MYHINFLIFRTGWCSRKQEASFVTLVCKVAKCVTRATYVLAIAVLRFEMKL